MGWKYEGGFFFPFSAPCLSSNRSEEDEGQEAEEKSALFQRDPAGTRRTPQEGPNPRSTQVSSTASGSLVKC